MQLIAAVSACVAALALATGPASAYSTGGWIDASATFYGTDAWSLHDGSCGFGFVCPDRWTDELASGYDLVAISDQSPLYNGPRGSQCGQCLEVSCRSGPVTDDLGVTVDREGLCLDGGATSVKVKIVDTCDCTYAANAASNARWCCGDGSHLDMSKWALDKLVTDSTRWGVFPVAYRTVDCGAQLANPAPALANFYPDPHAGDKPASLDCSTQVSGTSGSSGSSSGLATEAKSSQRATVSTAVTDKGGYHSRKFWNRRKNLVAARGQIHSKGWYNWVTSYYTQYSQGMEKTADKGISNPFN